MEPEQAGRDDGTFVVRIWWEHGSSEGHPRQHWRGLVKHVRSGKQLYFSNILDLINFIQEETGVPAKTDIAPQGLL